eukprot:scaffold59612_cov24-Tisochrysis_lutea.AAC.1
MDKCQSPDAVVAALGEHEAEHGRSRGLRGDAEGSPSIPLHSEARFTDLGIPSSCQVHRRAHKGQGLVSHQPGA